MLNVNCKLVQSLVDDLVTIQNNAISWLPNDEDNDSYDQDDNHWVNVRIRYTMDGGYEIKAGCSQYDTDHTGHWGYSCIYLWDERSELGEKVLEMLDELIADLVVTARIEWEQKVYELPIAA